VSNYLVVERPLSVNEYRMLRRQAGWNDIEDEAAVATALASSLYTVCIETGDEQWRPGGSSAMAACMRTSRT
jgi:hypothetical protein